MHKRFLQKLQQVKLKDLMHIFLFLIAIIPAIIYKASHKPFWLICEYEMEARDNGYYFFKYMRQNHKEIETVYAINKSSADYARVKKLGKVVEYGTLKHWVLYLAATYNISSQKGGKPNAAICYLLEVYGPLKNKRVFLQHGIIKDDLPYVHYKNAKFSMFTTSTKQEYEYVSQRFGYPPGIVKQIGLCRFDDLIDTSDGNVILIMPTWRQWIAHADSDSKNIEDISDFKNTEYYKAWSSVLNSQRLNEIIIKYNKSIVFYPHRNMQPYVKHFVKNNKRIKIAHFPEYDVHELLKSSSLLITDYSSVAMDFAYLNKPVIYYQFDYDRFRSNHMEEGYFSYKNDGFGEVVEDKHALLDTIENYILNNYQLSPKYQQRINSFFDLRDHNNCERTYSEILKIRDAFRGNAL